MHIILGALGSIVTILWLLHRLAEMGIDLGGLNPWLWRRRRQWRDTYVANPIYSIESPMEVTALLIVAVAKAEGDMSSEEKREILTIFSNEFQLSESQASELLTSSSHLLGRGDEMRENLSAVLSPSLERFSREQAEAALELLGRIAAIASEPSPAQSNLIDQTKELLQQQSQPPGKWN